MRCPRCNVAIPIGGEMCVKCGYNVHTKRTDPKWNPPAPKPVPPTPDPVPPIPDPVPPVPDPIPPVPDPVPPTPKPKPRRNTWKRLLITLIACLIGRGVGHVAGSWIAQREFSNRSTSRQSIFEKAPEATEAKEASPEFQAFLQAHGILDYEPNLKGNNVECFAIDQGDGIFEFMEFRYSGDTIREFQDMIFIPLSGMSSSEKDALVNSVKQQFAPLSSLDNCTVTYDQSEYYLATIITYQDVHKAANIRAMTDLGIIDKDYTTGLYATSVSLNKTKADLLANGAIQR